jgi:hypothetical protein
MPIHASVPSSPSIAMKKRDRGRMGDLLMRFVAKAVPGHRIQQAPNLPGGCKETP